MTEDVVKAAVEAALRRKAEAAGDAQRQAAKDQAQRLEALRRKFSATIDAHIRPVVDALSGTTEKVGQATLLPRDESAITLRFLPTPDVPGPASRMTIRLKPSGDLFMFYEGGPGFSTETVEQLEEPETLAVLSVYIRDFIVHAVNKL